MPREKSLPVRLLGRPVNHPNPLLRALAGSDTLAAILDWALHNLFHTNPLIPTSLTRVT